MRLSPWLPLAVLSAFAAVCGAATRPHYGGTLRVEIQAAPASLNPYAGPLASLVFEPLVRLDAAGAPQPCLALSWQHDAALRRWQFNLRPGVKFHDGFLLVPAAVVSSLESELPGVSVTAANDAVIIRANRAMPNLLLDLAHDAAIFARDAEGQPVGTGPFRAVAWEPGHRATLAANEEYWGGRPFLDSIEIQMGRPRRDQLLDLEIGKADIVEVGPGELRRASGSGTVWSSAPVNLIALVFAPGRARDPRAREALALSIDRATMHAVLLQKQGEITGALLPQWLSGYAFAFRTTPDLVRARALAATLPASARTLTLSYDPTVVAGRPLAERVAVNAHDAGFTVRVVPQDTQADLRLVEIPLPSLDPERALAALGVSVGSEAMTPIGSAAEALYETERRLLEDFRAIPLFHLPDLYAAANRVRVLEQPALTRMGGWRFDGIWLSGNAR
jgi:peptide/nickel transport system substrate-binding protein